MRERPREALRAIWALAACLLALAASLLGAPVAGAQLQRAAADAVRGELLVQFEPGTSGGARGRARERAGTRALRGLRRPGLQLLRTGPGTSVAEAVRRLEADPRVRYAEPNLAYRAAAVSPSDPRFPELWGLAKVRAPDAWALTTGDPSVTVAVVDTGVAYDHPDLAANMANDLGRDFVDGDGDPRDLNGHGTHVAGTVAAIGDNGIGVAGVSWHSRLVAVRVLDATGTGDSATLVDGLGYAGDIGAQVANVSISGQGFSRAVADAVAAHPNTLYVVAAGNDGTDNDADTPQTPCNVDAPNLVCVAATTPTDGRADFSDTGPVSVDLGAPGTDILSTAPARETRLADDFEDASVFAGQWQTGGTPDSWARTTEAAAGGSFSLTDSPGADYPDGASNYARTKQRLDLTGREGCAVDYALRLDIVSTITPPVDRLQLETSLTTTSWISRDSWTGSTGGDFVGLRTPLGSDGQQVYLRFHLISNADGQTADGAYVDDVRVSCLGGPYDDSAYAFLDGTSMATPHVAGAAALVWARRPGASVTSVRCDLLGTGTPTDALAGRTVTGRRLDAAAALSAGRSQTPPAATGDATEIGPSGAILRGVADPCGTRSAYQFEYGTSASYGSVAPPAPAEIGSALAPRSVSQTIGGLAPGTAYHYRLVTIRGGERLPGPDRVFATPAPAEPAAPPATEGTPPPPGATPTAPGARLTLKDVRASCRRTGTGRRRTVTCTLRRATAVRRVSARLTRRNRLYARASGRPGATGRLKLKLVRRLRPGRYRVTLTLSDTNRAKRTLRLTVRIR